MIEMEYRDKKSRVGCGASNHFAEQICARKNITEKDDDELLVKNHQNPLRA